MQTFLYAFFTFMKIIFVVFILIFSEKKNKL